MVFVSEQVTYEEYQQERNIIHNILYNNSFPIRPHKPPIHIPIKQLTPSTTHKWASFTYIGKETSYIMNTFKWTELMIAFRTTYGTEGYLQFCPFENVCDV